MVNTPVSRKAPSVVVRVPDELRERIDAHRKRNHVGSANTTYVQAFESWLDGHEELQLLLDGARLLKKDLETNLQKLKAERSEVIRMRDELNKELGAEDQATSDPS